MSRASRYNHFQHWRDGYYIAFNARTGAVGLMTGDNYQTYLRLVEKMSAAGQSPALAPSEQELLGQLEYGLFMYPDHRDEFEAIKFQHELAKYDMTRLMLVLAPTLACNMACPYCYEGNKRGKMSPEVAGQILRFVEQKAASLSRLEVLWYGGEPLLAFDLVEELNLALIKLARERQFEYTTGIVTNGYLLTPEVVDKLAAWKTVLCQVTIDGPARLHNQKRPLKNGQESFSTIMGNLNHAATKLPVSIRVNVDKTYDTAVITEMLREFQEAGLREKVAIYFGQLEPASAACAAIAETCFDNVDFSEAVVDYYRLLLDHGFHIENLPRPTATHCMTHRVNAFLIDPEGYLYRCWNYTGDPSKAMGHVRDAINYEHQNFTSLFTVDPFADELCRNCSILPVCMGGCPSQRVDRGLTGEQACQSWKHNLLPMLEIIARSRQQKAQSPPKEQV